MTQRNLGKRPPVADLLGMMQNREIRIIQNFPAGFPNSQTVIKIFRRIENILIKKPDLLKQLLLEIQQAEWPNPLPVPH